MIMINFEAEVIEVKAKKDGLDKMYKIVLSTNQEECLKLQEWIAKDTVRIEVKE